MKVDLEHLAELMRKVRERAVAECEPGQFLEFTAKDPKDAEKVALVSKYWNHQIATKPAMRAEFEKAMARGSAQVLNHLIHGTPIVGTE